MTKCIHDITTMSLSPFTQQKEVDFNTGDGEDLSQVQMVFPLS